MAQVTSVMLAGVTSDSLLLSGLWKASENVDQHRRSFAFPAFDDSQWTDSPVPGHWSQTAGLHAAGGPMLFRRQFEASPSAGRWWLTFDGIWDHAIVWFDGAYIGEVEGYFAPKSFDVTALLSQGAAHLVAAEVERHLSPWDAGDHHMGGLWADVRLQRTGPVRLSRCKVVCTEASDDRAVLSISAELDAIDVSQARITTAVIGADGATLSSSGFTRAVAVGSNRVTWTAVVEDPPLWWPYTHGDQAMVDIVIEVSCFGEVSDRSTLRSGLRHVSRNNGYLFVNGERMYLRGVASSKPLTALSPTSTTDFVSTAKTAGANVIDVGSWVESRSFYTAADEAGVLLLQTLPSLPGAPRAAGRLSRQCVEVLGHHPSIAAWTQPTTTRTLMSRLLRRNDDEASTIDPSRPLIEGIEPWSFDKAGDQMVAGVIGRWSRRTRLVRFRSTAEEAPAVIDELRSLKYQPLGGFICEDLDPVILSDALLPVTVFIHSAAGPQPGKVWQADVLVANDTSVAVEGITVSAEVTLGGHEKRWRWEGNAGPDSVAVVGRFRLVVPLDETTITGTVSLHSEAVTVSRPVVISLTAGTE